MKASVSCGPSDMELEKLSAIEIRDAIRNGQVSVLQYAKALIRRFEERDGDVHAWAYFDKAGILSQAEGLDALPAHARGQLHGVAVGIKDNIHARDMPTRYFSPLHANDGNSASDAAAVGVLRASGALLLGKTATTELACTLEGGPCVNPRSPDGKERSPGGSSSGSAAAVADGQVPLAIGTQTAGSIVRPGSFCGIWAFKPTWGLVSTEGVSHCAATFDTVGFFANQADDLDLVARAYRLHRGETRYSAEETDSAASEKPLHAHGLHVAMIKTPVWDAAKPATGKAWQRAIDLLAAAGAHVEAVDLPAQFRRATRWYEVILASEIQSSFLSRYMQDKDEDKLDGTLRSLVENRHRLERGDILEALDGVAMLRQSWDAIAAQYDAVITPSVTGEAPEGLDNTGSAVFNTMWTMLHAPTLNVPGLQGESGMPVGLTVAGGRYTDMDVLRVGKIIGETFAKAGCK